MSEFTQAYIECMFWASTDDDGEPLDSIDAELSPEAIERINADCADFLADPRTLELCEEHGMSQSGHDFWLTRNHHGAGFWDRGYGEEGTYLTDRAHADGGCDAYIGDDGLVYLA